MFIRIPPRTITAALLCLLAISAACDSDARFPPTTPTSKSPGALAVNGISPDSGSSAGGTPITITGYGFESGSTVTLGGTAMNVTYVDSHKLIATTPAGAAGLVDVLVTNPNGQFDRLREGYAYASPETYDVNGEWKGGADSHSGTVFGFTIQDRALIRVSCGTSESITLSPPLPVVNGEFSLTGLESVTISGRIVSPDRAFGTITIPGVNSCVGQPWYAVRQESEGLHRF
jgi:IPT/TIG domain-containing protein